MNQFCEPREPRDKVPVLYVILRAQYFWFCLQCAGVLFAACNSFVCSVLEFCLQCAGVLFAAYNSFVCSALELCLQCEGVLFPACNSFSCSMHVFFYSFFFVCSVQEMICLTCYLCLQGMSYLQCFLFVKAVSSVGHRTSGICRLIIKSI